MKVIAKYEFNSNAFQMKYQFDLFMVQASFIDIFGC